MKVKLVYSSFVTRVVVEDNATEDEIIVTAREKIYRQIQESFGENVEDIVDDTECPEP